MYIHAVAAEGRGGEGRGEGCIGLEGVVQKVWKGLYLIFRKGCAECIPICLLP